MPTYRLEIWGCCFCPQLFSSHLASMPSLPSSPSLRTLSVPKLQAQCLTPGTHPLMLSSPSALYLSQHQGLSRWVVGSYQMTKILEFQLQHQSFQCIFKVNLLSDLPAVTGKNKSNSLWSHFVYPLITLTTAESGGCCAHFTEKNIKMRETNCPRLLTK